MSLGPDPSEDERSVDDLFAAALAEQWLDQEDYEAGTWASRTLYWRSTREIFDRLVALCHSTDSDERCLGIDLIGEVLDTSERGDGRWREWEHWQAKGFLDESMAVLTELADPKDPDEDVRYAIVSAFESRSDPRGLDPLLGYLEDRDEDVREELARALRSCQEHLGDAEPPPEPLEELRMRTHNDRIAAALLTLARDEYGDVRNWALFGLAQLGIDTPAIRDAFARHMDDPHEDAAMEAICGLASLGDPRAVEPLIELLESGVGWSALEAAVSAADPALLPVLLRLREENPEQPWLDEAIEACQRGAGPSASG